MSVGEGDTVEFGQKLFEDRKTPGVIYTAPASGKIVAVNRGPKRILESVEIEISENDEADPLGVTPKPQHAGRDAIVGSLVASGLWTSLRTRPFSKSS